MGLHGRYRRVDVGLRGHLRGLDVWARGLLRRRECGLRRLDGGACRRLKGRGDAGTVVGCGGSVGRRRRSCTRYRRRQVRLHDVISVRATK